MCHSRLVSWLGALLVLGVLVQTATGSVLGHRPPSRPVGTSRGQQQQQLQQPIILRPRYKSWSDLDNATLSRCDASSGTSWDFMPLVDAVLTQVPRLVDPFVTHLDQQEPLETDFVVVGGGSAGSVVAARLSEAHRVVLLEAGGPEPAQAQVPSFYITDDDTRRQLDWHFMLEPQTSACLGAPGGMCSWPRGKVLGGTSTINGMMYMRGNRWDYDHHWKSAGVTGWGWSDVLPYFLKSEDNRELGQDHVEDDHHSVGGFMTVQRFPDQPPLAWAILAAGAELGYRSNVDLNGSNQTGFTVAQATVRDGQRLSMSRAFLHPASERTNLTVLLNARVLRVLTEKGRAIGVEYIRNGKYHKVLATKEVVLSAGTIQTPQLLMLSGIGPRKHLEDKGIKVVADLPGVGQNLENHVSFAVDFTVSAKSPLPKRLDMTALREFLANGTGAMTSTGLSQVTAMVHSRYSNGTDIDLPDIQLFFEGAIANCSLTGIPGEPLNDNNTRPFRITPVVLRPLSRGQVLLRSDDPTEPPRIHANDLQHQMEVDLLIDGVRIAQRLFRTSALQEHDVQQVFPEPPATCRDAPLDSDAYWECMIRYRTSPENHQACSARMGADGDPMAVLDSRMRVRGVAGLRVVDASAMPHVVTGNLNAAVIMVAERGADLIKEDHANDKASSAPRPLSSLLLALAALLVLVIRT